MPKAIKVLCGELDADPALIREAVITINTIRMHGALQTALAVGEYVIGTFFDGDIETFRRRHEDHVSFRQLAQHEELEMSATSLWTAVQMVSHREVLGAAVTEQLSLRHHQVLIGVQDEQLRRTLAGRVLEEGLSRDDLQELARKTKPGARSGRKSLPAWFKQARRGAVALRRLGEMEIEGEVSEARMEELSGLLGEAQKALDELKLLVEG